MSIIVVWDLGLQLSQHLAFLFFCSFRHWGLVLLSSWDASCIPLWFWSWLGLGSSLRCFLGLRCSCPCSNGITHQLGCLRCWCSTLFLFFFFIRRMLFKFSHGINFLAPSASLPLLLPFSNNWFF